MSTANEEQIDGSHYKDRAIQPWDYIVQNQIPYLEGNIIKYVSRWRSKNGMTDLLKAQHYLTKLIETEHERIGSVAPAGGTAKG
jgi:Zn/Cd-binding protein ZinT